mgnify:CR=1 FL=1
MLDRLRHARLPAVVLALYALATLVVGFAHKPAVAQVGSDLAALALQADAPVSLCEHPGAPNRQAAVDHFCDACALTSAPGLPAAGGGVLTQRHALSLALGIENYARRAPALAIAPASRGPPAA